MTKRYDKRRKCVKTIFYITCDPKMKITYFLFNMEYGILPLFSINKNKNVTDIK